MPRLKLRMPHLKAKMSSIKVPLGPSGKQGVIFFTEGMAVFDKSFLKRDWSKVNMTPLRRSGLWVRKIMIRSIRKVKSDRERLNDFLTGKTKRFRRSKPSKAGSPPRSRYRGHPFRLIASEVLGGSAAIVGHIGFNPGKAKTAMSVHEFGQTVQVKQFVIPKKKRGRRRTAHARRAARKAYLAGKIPREANPVVIKTRTVKMPERKFAEPAMKKGAPKLPSFWKDSVRPATVKTSVGGG